MTWSGNLKTYETILLDGTIFSQIGDGSHTIRYLITELNGSVTGFKRDTISIRFSSIQSSVMIPYTQDFSEPVFPYDKWTIDNPYPEIPTFERADIGYVKALRIPFFNIPKEYLSALYLPAFSFSSVSMPRLTFDLACTHNNSVIRHAGYDLINICASTDCNKTINILCTISSIDYQSAPDDSTYFIPLENQWKPVSLSLPSLANKDSVLLVFITGPTEGNNMYLRNIQLSNAAGLEEETNRKNFSIYPVPAKDILYIDFLNNFRIAHIELYNQFGIKVIEKDHSGGTKVTLNLRDLSAGCYLLRISTAFETFTKKIIVQ
jgi:hypothetical protein